MIASTADCRVRSQSNTNKKRTKNALEALVSGYNMTDVQKDLLRNLVGYTRAGQLNNDFFVHEQPDPQKNNAFVCSIQMANGSYFRFTSKSDLHRLCDHSPSLVYGRNNVYSITQAGFDAVDCDFAEGILLETVQEELLIRVVEAARNLPPDQRRRFMVARSRDGDSLLHPGLPEDKRKVYYSDIEALARGGLLVLSYGSRGEPFIDITPLGFQHYEHLKKRIGDAVGRIETTIRRFLDAPEFQRKYPEAYQKWSSAEELLWQTDTEQQLTMIGHLCREATQAFSAVLVDHYKPLDVSDYEAKPVARVRAILDMRRQRLGSAEKLFLKAILAYWRTVDGLIQRQVHGALQEGEKLVWEDARRIVFQTAIVMFEIDKAIGI
jgi:hypothetical protein